MTFNNSNFTYNGELSGYDYDSILRNTQDFNNIQQLFSISDYYTNSEPLVRGMIKEVYTPFSVSEDWKLIGADEAVKKKYEEYYRRIHLKDMMNSIFLQYYKYGNVYCYLKEDGQLMTLPVHLVRISGIAVNGEPVIEFHCRKVRDDVYNLGIKAQKDYIDDDDLRTRVSALPEEVVNGILENVEWVQLNPENTYVLQDLKEDWQRYAVPMIASCLSALSKKELISKYENALLNLAMRSFVHVRYGDDKHEVLPTINDLNAVSSVFKAAMTGTALAVTNNWCEAGIIQPDTKDMFEYDKYKGVNADILSAGGISGIIVSGRSEDGSTFATAQVSMQTAAIRIKHARDNFCEMMDNINLRLNGRSKAMPHSANDRVPKFTFPPVDLAGNKAFQDTCYKLYTSGVISKETLLQTHGYDIKQEVERKKNEADNGIDTILSSPDEKTMKEEDTTSVMGRPTLDDSERKSDPAKSVTGRQPSATNPEGSKPQTG